ncbi:MAG TPA: RDD family protein [Streptosporangiaceae bacterium]|nr:RDD family protein [Streptosporangiaceae bacterium]
MTEQHQAGSLHTADSGAPARPGYPGADLGRPATGHGAIAGSGRRIGAIFIDWILCTFIVLALIRPSRASVEYWTLLVFGVQDYVLTALTGFTIGKRLLQIRVVRLDGKLVGLGWGLLRTVLLLLAVPALLVNRDLRGLHDRAANTAVVRH